MTTLAIRPLQEADFLELTPRLRSWWGGRDLRLPPRFFFQHFCSTSLVASAEDRVLAFLIGFLSPDHARVAYINYVSVDPDWRRQGLAAQLYREFFRIAQAGGRHEVHCITPAENLQSVAFHQALGFSLVASDEFEADLPVHRNYNGQGGDFYQFRKPLSDDQRT